MFVVTLHLLCSVIIQKHAHESMKLEMMMNRARNNAQSGQARSALNSLPINNDIQVQETPEKRSAPAVLTSDADDPQCASGTEWESVLKKPSFRVRNKSSNFVPAKSDYESFMANESTYGYTNCQYIENCLFREQYESFRDWLDDNNIIMPAGLKSFLNGLTPPVAMPQSTTAIYRAFDTLRQHKGAANIQTAKAMLQGEFPIPIQREKVDWAKIKDQIMLSPKQRSSTKKLRKEKVDQSSTAKKFLPANCAKIENCFEDQRCHKVYEAIETLCEQLEKLEEIEVRFYCLDAKTGRFYSATNNPTVSNVMESMEFLVKHVGPFLDNHHRCRAFFHHLTYRQRRLHHSRTSVLKLLHEDQYMVRLVDETVFLTYAHKAIEGKKAEFLQEIDRLLAKRGEALRDQITKLCPALAYKQKNGDWFNVSSFLYYQELANGEVEPIDESSGNEAKELPSRTTSLAEFDMNGAIEHQRKVMSEGNKNLESKSVDFIKHCLEYLKVAPSSAKKPPKHVRSLFSEDNASTSRQNEGTSKTNWAVTAGYSKRSKKSKKSHHDLDLERESQSILDDSGEGDKENTDCSEMESEAAAAASIQYISTKEWYANQPIA